ncbi:MAG TPA: SgcJ/EcaC family oxidoreductase [Steroidobacteraceae bacterium]|jgi:uncharacterized protein (TIGR02246 family)|nr:SgcJ/EcaC family oxidoreductase [Steroidobacteraceae bacterium]
MVSDDQQIRELIAKWMAATKTGDVATVLSLMTDDVVFLVVGQPPFGKEKFAELMKSPPGAPRPQIDGRSEIQEIQVLGDYAFVWTRLNVEVTPPGGQTVKRSGHTLSVLRRTGGQWRLARDANLLTTVS